MTTNGNSHGNGESADFADCADFSNNSNNNNHDGTDTATLRSRLFSFGVRMIAPCHGNGIGGHSPA